MGRKRKQFEEEEYFGDISYDDIIAEAEAEILKQEEENKEEYINEVFRFEITEIFQSVLSYTEISEFIRNKLNENYALRNNKTILVFQDGTEQEMTLGRLFLNVLLLRSFAKFGEIPKPEDLFQNESVTQDALEGYFNFILNHFKDRKNINFDDLRVEFYNVVNELSDIGAHYNVEVGNSISLRDIIRLEEEDPKFDELTHTKLKPGQFNDIEKQFSDLGKKIMKYFRDHTDTELHPFVASGTRIKPENNLLKLLDV